MFGNSLIRQEENFSKGDWNFVRKFVKNSLTRIKKICLRNIKLANNFSLKGIGKFVKKWKLKRC